MAHKLFKRKTQPEFHYNSEAIDSTGALYRVIIGQRSNGKTYNFLEKVIKEYFENGLPSAYLRRWAEEIRPKNLSALFNPFQKEIIKKSNGKYNGTTYRNNAFTLCYYDEDGKIQAKAETPLLYTVAVNTAINAKGADRGQLAYIAYDEFMSRDGYLKDEFVLFCNVLSSLIRDRDIKAIYLLGNTVNKYSPYFEEFGIRNVDSMKQGEIYLYSYNNKELTLAVEYCASVEATKKVEKYYAFENTKLDMIKSGAFEVAKYPRFDRIQFVANEDTLLRSFLIDFNRNRVVGEIHKKGLQLIILFHPAGGEKNLKKWGYFDPNLDTWIWDSNKIVFTDGDLFSVLHQRYFGKGATKVHKLIYKIFGDQHVYYSSNETGEIVRNFILFSAKNM